MPFGASPEVGYVILLFALFVLPRFLQRYRLPSAVTTVLLGLVAGAGFGLFREDSTVALLSTFGISSLFLFAGLDVDPEELRREATVIGQHVLLAGLSLAGVAYLTQRYFGLALRPALLVALALLTPSTGFILESLATLGMGRDERFWIKSKAIATELLALAVLFFTLQSSTVVRLGLSTLALVAMIAFLPVVFRLFAARIVPHAPRSEFAFLLMVAILCAYGTRALGVYYLVGAFIVGMAAQRFRERLPAMASDDMLRAVEMFATFFVPFYFFHAGLELRRDDFSWRALGVGVLLLAVATPLRVLLVALHRRVALGEPIRRGSRIAVSMLPTLVFTLVIAQILRAEFGLSRHVFGGLIIYTLANTLVPSFVLRLPPPELTSPHALDLDLEHDAGPSDAVAGDDGEAPPPDASGLASDEPA